MTVSVTKNKMPAYTGDGVTRNWDFDFPILNVDDMKVYVVYNDVTTLLVANYNVDLLNNYVTYPTVASGLDILTSDYQIILVRELPLLQESDYENQGKFPSKAIETNIDRLTMIDQQQQEELDRVYKIDIGTGNVDFEDVKTITFTDGTIQTSADVGSASSVSSTNGTQVLDGGSDGTDSTYIGDVAGNADTSTLSANITATDNTANETTYIPFLDGATGSQGIETNTSLTYNPSTKTLTTDEFVGDLTGSVNATSGGLNPVGILTMFAGSSAPVGYLLCDGSEINRTTYASLFSIIGETYGAGDASTTFNIPDMRETYAVGIGTRGASVTAHDVFALGEFKDDQEQGHYHTGSGAISTLAQAGVNYTTMDNDTSSTGKVNAKEMVTDGSNGTPRTGTTTRGKALGVNYIIKY